MTVVKKNETIWLFLSLQSNRSVLKVYFRIGAVAGNHWVMGILLSPVHKEQAISENLFAVTSCPSKAIG